MADIKIIFMYNPVSTYRIQFNKEYTFSKLKEDLKYLFLLNPGSIYASPVFISSPGSMHGYDIADPHSLNPEIGTYEEFVEIIRELKIKKTGWIQDIVPNHMAFHMNNRWLMDVLENGKSSKYAGFFDIDFSHPLYKDKLIVPLLAKKLKDTIKSSEITVDWMNGSFIFRYYDYYFPFNFESFRQIIVKNLASTPAAFHKIWYDLALDFKEDFLQKVWPGLKEKIEKIYKRSTAFRRVVENIIKTINGDKNLIRQLLSLQNYKLCSWVDSSEALNYRRFFTINSLICLKMENDNLFESYHSFIEQQVRAKRFQGLRIDHIDGLRNPVDYCEKLRILTGESTYLVAEKILGDDEELLHELPLQGTTGYDFLGMVNNLFTYQENMFLLDKYYRNLTGIKEEVEDIIYMKKKQILIHWMNSELDNLARMFDEAFFVNYDTRITQESIKQAIGEFLIIFPVYKAYSREFPLSAADIEAIRNVFAIAFKKNPSIHSSLKVLENVFITQKDFDQDKKEKALSFLLRCMQFTGPLMAKGVEDTVMYYYNSFICHNEVGDHPGSQGLSVREFHNKMLNRQRFWPMSMNATSTHDTKRGEDVRARLNVISENAGEWTDAVGAWIRLNSRYKKELNGSAAPSLNEEYFIYQTLAGVFPFDGQTDDAFLKRLDEYLIKSLREAKINTNWINPDDNYERAVIGFARQILSPENEFLKAFIPFQQKIQDFGIINSLSQVLLKATCPGIPDFYQGTELWDLSMVDPDNRRPVNYNERSFILNGIIKKSKNDPDDFFRELFSNRKDGHIKLWMTYKLMEERRSEPDLFLHGNYMPLTVKGKFHRHLIAFARTHNNVWYIIIAPLYVSVLGEDFNEVNWEDTRILLPDTAPKNWSVFSGVNIKVEEEILIKEILKVPCPVYLKSKTEMPVRHAGILAHLSSLPGKYGTGDLGDEAYEFAELLRECRQSYWQILPFNPVDKGYGYSPYSSDSAFAGNLMFLSPDKLIDSGLVKDKSFQKSGFRESVESDFKKAIELRALLLEDAYVNFNQLNRPYLRKKFRDFCEKESWWLDDYSLFVNLKKEFNGIPWYKWPEKIKDRNESRLKVISRKYNREIEKVKFGQFLFYEQWQKLKQFVNNNNIKIVGDISFYVNYDSTDVWSNPHYFKLDKNKGPVLVAGVPPDYFSRTGQLWNMPVYNWKAIKEDGYGWWMRRIKRNLDLCDFVRLDHFRGFSEYWEVPYGEKTAENGKWTEGPGADFLGKVKTEFPEMPFFAEDLGSIDKKVHKLRDEFSLPGMVILQFAFGDNTPMSGYIPHNHTINCVVYTGTHDNNTTKGWFVNELGEKNKKEAEEYAGHRISIETCNIDFIRMAYNSVARIAIIPVQDLLGLDESARFNLPSTSGNNWKWKLRKEDLKNVPAEKIRRMAYLSGRI
jgi:malto-oligosyltrehalose synthase/4-alpha-glucanotransferase